ncbi:GNAT family N-acetyltransferase [Tateyamaria omphalii]|uniref:GNAT family N-acetyltransferase n=1 Tax=Tateyamaria omphalii TaxID=299262 RepID=UPI001C9978B2|nr:GNAT family N-acetyltransferase [Tateyamaria omphalii]MBY5933082.1 GNAT family N-acetyltransferase [Tateyamaria omphalii]
MADAGMAFPDQPTLTGPTLVMRPLQADDETALTHAASDPLIWAVHPQTDRHKAEVFRPYFQMLLTEGGTLAATLRDTGEIIGCSRYYPTDEEPGAHGIGYTFLTRAHWGGTANWEMKSLMLDHAVQHLDTVWFHIGADNIRSKRATAKLGVRHVDTQISDLGSGPFTHDVYRLDKSVWQARQESGSA